MAAIFRNVRCCFIHPRPCPLARDPYLHDFPLHGLPYGFLQFGQSGSQSPTIADRMADRPFDDKISIHQCENTIRISRLDRGKPFPKETGRIVRGRWLFCGSRRFSGSVRCNPNRPQSQAKNPCCDPHHVTLPPRFGISSDTEPARFVFKNRARSAPGARVLQVWQDERRCIPSANRGRNRRHRGPEKISSRAGRKWA